MNNHDDDGSFVMLKNYCPFWQTQFTHWNGPSNKRILIISSRCFKNSILPSYLFKSPFITHINVQSQYFSLTKMLQLTHPATAG